MRSANSRQLQKAFTLIELLVVIAIVGILAGMVTVNMSGATGSATIAKAKTFSSSMRSSLLMNRVSEWRFDDGSGIGATDLVGTNTGTLINFNFSGDSNWKTADCISGGCLSFDGINDHVEAADSEGLNPGSGDFTVEVWFKLNSVGAANYSILYNKENLYEASAGGGYFTYAWRPHWVWDGGTSFPVDVGEWYHAVVVYDHAKQYLYKNGKMVYSRSQTGDMETNTNALRIGARGAPGAASSFFPGLIDEVRIYNAALTASAVRDQHALGLDKLLAGGQITSQDYQQRIAGLNSNYAANK
ncbi:MAG: LamG-like jellyroll fold domain-containing protein [Candidatus Paceibacterota bacterium]|jgi:prepilin-type N-terminal cleavage/methylation domain-containing protein